MARVEEEGKSVVGKHKSLANEVKGLAEKITVGNFVRYFGPGIILFGIVRVSGIDFCKKTAEDFATDKSIVASAALFLILGVLLHQMYRGFFYNGLIACLKDSNWLKKRRWENYREVLKQSYKRLPDELKIGLKEISSYDAEFIWRQMKRKFAPDGYSEEMDLWAGSIHLLYFTGISMMLFSILEFWLSRACAGFFFLLGGVLVLLGAYFSDTEYERDETHRYLPEELSDEEKAEAFLKPIVQSPAFNVGPRED
ncbi:MAG: hypothetical protein KAV87_31205 [Desulfobacteraceae bacterium]|nr:hypothetical protein [Desulfobacteraceae bacterium]